MLQEQQEPVKVIFISESTGLAISTIHRALKSLRDNGLATSHQDPSIETGGRSFLWQSTGSLELISAKLGPLPVLACEEAPPTPEHEDPALAFPSIFHLAQSMAIRLPVWSRCSVQMVVMA